MIREANVQDADVLAILLEQLGYENTSSFLPARIQTLLEHPDASLAVYETEGRVFALLCLHVIPQIALLGPFLRISYFVVDETMRSVHIGATLEAYALDVARKKGCDRIEVHCHERRKDAHRFYARCGYVESPKYFVKNLHVRSEDA